MITHKKKNEKTTEIYFDETPSSRRDTNTQYRVEETATCLCREVSRFV